MRCWARSPSLPRPRSTTATIASSLAVAAAAPIVSSLEWGGVALPLRDYLVPSPSRGRFPFFPCGAYVGFGLAAGAIVKRTTAERMDRLMQWGVLIGFGLVLAAQ